MGANFRYFARGLIATSLALASACSQTIDPTSKAPTATTSGDRDQAVAARICTDEVNGATRASVSGFFDKQVRNIEGPVTYCLYLDDTSDNLSAKLRIEYEDDFGIRFYETLDDGVFYAKMQYVAASASTSGTAGGLLVEGGPIGETRLEVIFIDDYGMIQLKGKALEFENHQEDFEATIKYYNFPSYEEALTAAVAEQQRKCREGELTVAQCLGYNFPMTYWWNQPLPVSPGQRLLQEAQAIFADSTKSKVLGGIVFNITNVLEQ